MSVSDFPHGEGARLQTLGLEIQSGAYGQPDRRWIWTRFRFIDRGLPLRAVDE